jgi:DNA-binding transcriptional regulator YhcF (GntR family)
MRFWITKNGEVPVREQLIRQVVLGIMSEELPGGYKLPSVRAVARRHSIHANTVSAAYHDLVQQGWLEPRRGSGLFVRKQRALGKGPLPLDDLVRQLLHSALVLGYDAEEVLRAVERRVKARTYRQLYVFEPEAGMREILLAELCEIPGLAPAVLDSGDAAQDGEVVTLPAHAERLRPNLPDGVLLLPLRPKSAEQALQGRTRPKPDELVFIVSRSAALRRWAHTILIAVGIDPQALCVVATEQEVDWRGRITSGAVVVADVVTASSLTVRGRLEVLRVLSDSFLQELRDLF